MAGVASGARRTARQLSLFNEMDAVRRPNWLVNNDRWRRVRAATVLCHACRAKEARYGFRDADLLERPSTLCFECFRLELERRHRAASQGSRRPNASGEGSSLAGKLEELSRRRRRAQIAARRALGAE